jgi:hypothetical protein
MNQGNKKSWFFEKTNKNDRPLAIQGIIRAHFENLYSNKIENLDKWTNF